MRAGAILCAAFLAMVESAWASAPCDGVERSLTRTEKETLAPAIAAQLRVKHAAVLRAFKLEEQSIYGVDIGAADEAFLFYPGDPLRTRYVAIWNGRGGLDEMSQTKEWTVENAPGVPNRLARCFAWHVTKNRDMRI